MNSSKFGGVFLPLNHFSTLFFFSLSFSKKKSRGSINNSMSWGGEAAKGTRVMSKSH